MARMLAEPQPISVRFQDRSPVAVETASGSYDVTCPSAWRETGEWWAGETEKDFYRVHSECGFAAVIRPVQRDARLASVSGRRLMRLTDNEVAVAAMIADAVREVDARIRQAVFDGPGARLEVAGEVFQVLEDGSLRVVMPKGTGRPAQARRTADRSSSAEKRSTS